MLPRLFVLASIVLITCACAPQGNVRKPVAAPDPLLVARAQANSGNYAGAATAYYALAQSASGAQSIRLKSLAALAYQDASDPASAAAILAELDAAAIKSEPLAALAQACALNQAGDYAGAYALTDALDARAFTPYQRGHYQRCRGLAALETMRGPLAAEALVSAYRYPYPDDQSESLNAATWRAITTLSEAQLAGLVESTSGSDKAWYALGLIAARTLFDTPKFIEHSNNWREVYAGHPAQQLLESLIERSEAISVRPRKIALMLPFGGALSATAQAVRDGFIAAWYLDPRSQSRPEISVYSVTDTTLAEKVAQALSDGAQFIVGPLQKPQVEQLRADSALTVNVLALNVTDNATQNTRAGFYQFGLTPEDEARVVANQAIKSGPRALLLAPDTTWGHRMAASYKSNWQDLGGDLVSETFFEEDSQAYAAAVKLALKITASELRHSELTATLNLPLHFSPRRRTDIDLILLAGFPVNARQIMPQLRYFDAQAIPVFSTSHVYKVTTSGAADRDLSGITFSDMPWLFGLVDHQSYNLVRRYWGSKMPNFARLYALGIDAYRVIPYLAKMRFQQNMRVPGVTGQLWMDGNGIVHRELSFARITKEGVQVLKNFRAVASP